MTGRILLIDDSKDDLQRFSKILAEEGYSIITAESGEEGLIMLKEHNPDLVVLDLVMPEMDGFEVCQRIKEHEDYNHIPIIFLTVKTYLDEKILGFELGASDFIPKSSDPREIKARVMNLLRTKNLFDSMKRLLVYDGLTNIYNRTYCQHRLYDEHERAKRYQRNFSCMVLDIDKFREINDRLGYPVGDIVLKNTAIVLKCNMRASDILCRYGGDKFVVILPETDSAGAYILAKRLCKIIEKENVGTETQPVSVTFSSGISFYRDATGILSVEELVTQAEVALYKAKGTGGNCTVVYGMEHHEEDKSN
ncbi:MAG: diguanylate cyclase [Candidatus Omnitrophota bacterium]